MFKLFSKMSFARLECKILRRQDREQAAYRPGFGTEDPIMSVCSTIESCKESASSCTAFVDFEEALYTLEHSSLWEVLLKQGFL